MFKEQILDYTKEHPIFFIKELQDYIGVDASNKGIMNTELTCIEKKGIIKRLSKGLYVVPKSTIFGTVLPNEAVIADKVYIEGNNGYLSGPSFLNSIGLSTLVPRNTYIKSNRYNYKIELDFFIISAPKIHLDCNNIRYIQFLDGIEDMQRYAVDHNKPYKILYQYIKSNNLDSTKLLILAHTHYKKNVLDTCLNLLSEYYENVTV